MARKLTLFTISLTILSAVFGGCADHEVEIRNNCCQQIWVGILGNYGKPHLEEGGFELQPCEYKSVIFPDAWGGRVWGRTGCGSGPCETGDCGGGRLKCNGAGGIPPVSLLEITFDGYRGLDYYDVSLVDGFNVMVSMAPKPGTFQTGNGDKYYCNAAACNANVNSICPAEQMRVIGTNGTVVACKSACLAFNTDRYCCRGDYGTPDKCPPFSYSEAFKEACPDAYSYAYDDQKSTFTCRSRPGLKTAYYMNFC